MKQKKTKVIPEIVIPKGYTVEEMVDMENDYADEKAIREQEVNIRFERE